jgi:hypothetical protein
MSYTPPIPKPIPLDQLCDYGCGNPAKYWFKRPKKYCCGSTANKCPEKKKENKVKREKRKILKEKFPIINLDYIQAIYPNVYRIDVQDGTLRYNKDKGIIEARCTYYECEREWYEVPMNHIGFREWALTEKESGVTNGGDGYKFYCDRKCRSLCAAHGKSGALIYKEVVMQHMIDWEEDEEWYGSEVSQADKNLWRETCLIRDGFLCVRCGKPAVHVHHEHAVKTHPMEVLDPDNGLSVCLRCHYDHFHERGSICSLSNLSKKVCYSVVNGIPKKPSEICKLPDGLIPI